MQKKTGWKIIGIAVAALLVDAIISFSGAGFTTGKVWNNISTLAALLSVIAIIWGIAVLIIGKKK